MSGIKMNGVLQFDKPKKVSEPLKACVSRCVIKSDDIFLTVRGAVQPVGG